VSTDTDPVSLLHEGPAGLAGDSTVARWVGERIPRVEDERMITGHGRYVDDLQKPGTVHSAFVRSTVARGLITGLDVSTPGVLAVLTAAEVNPRVHQLGRTVPGRGPDQTPRRVLADGDVRYVGEPIASLLLGT
jgi:aerobic carbon-monoxide dehydrogenase large subunit